MNDPVVVVGGGISGLMSAWYLRRDGREVTVIEREHGEAGCSYGNAGLIVPSHFVPLAAPGALSAGLRWIWSNHSPLSFRPRLSIDWARWLARFRHACTEAHVIRSARPLFELNTLSHRLYQEIAQANPGLGYAHRGLTVACLTEEALREEERNVAMAGELGADARLLAPAEVTELHNGIEFSGLGAAYFATDGSIDPRATMRWAREAVRDAGVQILKGERVVGFDQEAGFVRGVFRESGDRIAAGALVIAAGSWSPALTRTLGIRLLVEPGKGYGVTVHDPSTDLGSPVILSEEKVAMTPYPDRVRVVGTVETGGFRSTIRRSRLNGIFSSIPEYFPSLRVSAPADADVWHGFRSLSHDGLPYIGQHPSFANLVIATGHSMMGMSTGPATGLLVSELVARREPSIDIQPFAPDR